MDRGKQKEIASKGGKAAHQKGTAHEWTSEEAREAGRKGGMASHRRKQEGGADTAEPTTSSVGQEPPGGYRNEEAVEGIDREQMSGRGDGDFMR